MRRVVPLVALVMVTGILTACRASSTGAGAGAGTGVVQQVAGVAVSAPSTDPAGDWPRFLGPKANGFSPEKGIARDWNANPPKKLWAVPMSDGGYAGPVCAGGMVYILDHAGSQDVVRALDLRTGQDVWQVKYEDGADNDYGFARATPLVSGGKVYTLGRKGQLHCIDAKKGALVWSKNIVSEFGGSPPQWKLAGSPILDGQKLVVAACGPDAAVVALNKDSGDVIWKGGGSDRPGYSTPVIATIDGRKQYVVFQATGVVGVDAENGKLIWRQAWKTSYDVNAATPIVIGNRVFITSGYGTGCAMVEVHGGSASIVWQNKNMVSRFGTPLVANGYLYGIGEPGNMSCVDAQTGQLAWKQPGFGWGGLVSADGLIVAISGDSGDLVLADLSPKGYAERGRFTPLGGKSWTAPIIAQGCVIVRNERQLACYALK